MLIGRAAVHPPLLTDLELPRMRLKECNAGFASILALVRSMRLDQLEYSVRGRLNLGGNQQSLASLQGHDVGDDLRLSPRSLLPVGGSPGQSQPSANNANPTN